MKELETKRLILRTWQSRDLDALTKINQDPSVMEYFPDLQNRDQTKALINKVMKHFDKHGFGLYAVELKETGACIGFVGLNKPTFSAHFMPTIEIGWRLASTHWGNGYATEAAKRILDFAFNELNLPEIVSFTVPANKKSIRVMEKLNFTHNPLDDFDHPKLPKGHPLRRHVLYRLSQKQYHNSTDT